MSSGKNELARIKAEYSRWEDRLAGKNLYSIFNHSYLFMLQQRERDTIKLLQNQALSSLRDLWVLEVGCGRGGVLLEYLKYEVKPFQLSGCDLLLDRLSDAHQLMPSSPLCCADGQYLPYSSNQFDIVIQYTVFSSILDNDIKAKIAEEMLRVLQPKGLILWYDFWLNPTNRQTRGIRPKEIKHLFPDCRFDFHRITLAPPIARRLVPISWMKGELLEKLKIFNSHYLDALQPQ